MYIPTRFPYFQPPRNICVLNDDKSSVQFSSVQSLSWVWLFAAPWNKSYHKSRQHIKKQRCYFANKGPYSQSYGFSSSHVWMWELDHKESWAPKNWCFWNVVLEKTRDPLDCKEIQPVNPKGNQSWVFIGRTDVKWNSSTLTTSCEELTHWKRPWCWEGLRAGGEGDDRG